MTATRTPAATIHAVICELSAMGVWAICPGPGRIKLVCDTGMAPSEAVELAKSHKSALIDVLWPSIDEGLGSIDFAALDELDSADVPMCDRCTRFCDVQSLDNSWNCSHCDPHFGLTPVLRSV